MLDAGEGFRFPKGAMQYRAPTPDAMEQLGRAAATTLHAGSVIALVGGLGAGKTLWTKGLVAALGSPAAVTSPTFGLVHEYPGGRMPVFHVDFYRLETPAELLALGWDEYLEANGVVVAEWADKFPGALPKRTVHIKFEIIDEDHRSIEMGRGK